MVAFLCLLAACASVRPLSVDRSDGATIDSSNKTIALLNHTQSDVDLRRALTKAGFNVKKYVATSELEITHGDTLKRFNAADARYGITQYPGRIVDWGLGTGTLKYDAYSLEVSDLRTNDVVMTISEGGWIGGSGTLIDELASSLASNWK